MKIHSIKLLLITLALFTVTISGRAQTVDFSNSVNDSKLKIDKDSTFRKIEGGINLNQGSFSSNWTGGGVNSVALGLLFNVLTLDRKGKNSWRNDFQSQYGFVKNQHQQSRKNVDRLFFDTKYNRELTKVWSLFGGLNLQSQFANGYEYSTDPDSVNVRNRVSSFFSPAYLTEAIGIEYQPVPYFFVDFAPAALRQTIVMDRDLYKTFPGNYGVVQGKRVRSEVGIIQLVANFNKDIAKDINFKWRYLMYSSFEKSGIFDENGILISRDGPRKFNADHRLDAQITAKIAKYFNVNLTAIVLYDKDQVDKVQFAQGLSVGFLYQFK